MIKTHQDITINTLEEACLAENDDHLKSLIEGTYETIYGLDFIVDDQKRNMLHIMAECPTFNKWEILLSGFAYLDALDTLMTPLHHAIYSNNITACKALIKSGASVLVEDDQGQNCIETAILTQKSVILQIFIDSYFGKRYIIDNFLYICQFCISHGSYDSLHIILFHESISPTVKQKINNIDSNGLTLMHYVAQTEYINCASVLLEAGAEINIMSSSNDRSLITIKGTNDNGLPLDMASNPTMIEFLYYHGGKWAQNKTPSASELGFALPELHRAAALKDIDFIKKYSGDLNAPDHNQDTPLIVAIKFQQLLSIKALIERGADPSVTYRAGHTAFQIAAGFGNMEILYLLVGKLSQIDKLALPSAIKSKNPLVVRLLLTKTQRGYSPSLVSLMNDELLNLASENIKKTNEIIDYFIKTGFPVTPDLVQSAIKKELYDFGVSLFQKSLSTESVQNLKQADIPQDLLLAVVQANRVDLVKALLDCGTDPNFQWQGIPLFHFTASLPDPSVRAYLFKIWPNLASYKDSSGHTFLHRAAIVGNTSSITDGIEKYKLLETSSDKIDQKIETPLQCLMYKYSPTFLDNFKVFLNHKVDPCELNGNKQNIFHIAASHGQTKIIEILTSEGSPLTAKQIEILTNAIDINSNTPTMIAAKLSEDKQECANILSKFAPLPIFRSPLTEASIKDHLQHGYSPNSVDKNGQPLIILALNSVNNMSTKLNIIKLLLDSGVNTAVTYEKKNPMHFVIKSNNMELFELLWPKSSYIDGDSVKESFSDKFDEDRKKMIIKEEKRQDMIHQLSDQFIKDDTMLSLLSNLRSRVPQNTFTQELIEDSIVFSRGIHLIGARLQKVRKHCSYASTVGPLISYFLPILSSHNDIFKLSDAATQEKEHEKELSQKAGEPTTMIQFLSSAADDTPNSKLTAEDVLLHPHNVVRNLSMLLGPTSDYVKLCDNHPDGPLIQRAANGISKMLNEMTHRQLVLKTQNEIKSLVFQTSIELGKNGGLHINEMLRWHGIFDKVDMQQPKENIPGNKLDLPQWGLVCINRSVENPKHKKELSRNLFIHKVGKGFSLKKIGIYIFEKCILFGKQADTVFKIYFSCQPSEVIWDLPANIEGVIKAYTPIGMFSLKLIGQDNFAFISFQKAVAESQMYPVFDQDRPKSEMIYASWVESGTFWTSAYAFRLKSREISEINDWIINYLKKRNITLASFENGKPMINLSVITYEPPKGQTAHVLFDVSY